MASAASSKLSDVMDRLGPSWSRRRTSPLRFTRWQPRPSADV